MLRIRLHSVGPGDMIFVKHLQCIQDAMNLNPQHYVKSRHANVHLESQGWRGRDTQICLVESE